MIFDYKFLTFLYLFLLALNNQGLCQVEYANHIIILDEKPFTILESNDKILIEQDSLTFTGLLQKEIADLWSKGYLLASLDTIFTRDSSFFANIHIGEKYKFGEINVTDEQLAIVGAAGLKNVRNVLGGILDWNLKIKK